MSDQTPATKRKTFAQLNAQGLIEIVDIETGAVVLVQRDHNNLLEQMPSALVEHTMADGSRILLQKGIDPGAVAHVKNWPFSQVTADLICQKIATGGKISKICLEKGMPPYTVYVRWRRENAGFRQAIEDALRDRADYMRDKALEEAESATEDEVNKAKLKVETYKWAAGVDDQQRYSAKAKVETTGVMPVQIVISTGIDRTPLQENTIREVSNEQNQSEPKNINALSDSSRSTISSDGINGE